MTIPQEALLDTDILSAIMRRNPQGTDTHGLAVVTNNEAHFRRVRNLRIENWLA